MQAVILCGGFGTRLRDVADHIPKPMVPIGPQPILWHILKGFSAHGVREFVLCLGHQSWVIKRYFLDYHLARADFSLDLARPDRVRLHGPAESDDWQITLAETGADAMTGCRLKRVEKYLTGDDFLLTYGDGVGDVDVTRLLAFHRAHGRLGTVTAVRPPSRFGEIELDGSRVAEFNEKPVVSRGRINGGFFAFKRAFLDRLPDDPSLVLEQEPLIRLTREGGLMAFEHEGFWHPMDTSRDYRYLNELWAGGQAPWKTWDDAEQPAGGVGELVPAGVPDLLGRPEPALPRKPR